MLLTALAAWSTVRAVRRPLSRMLDALCAMARRDLTVRVEVAHADEFGEMAEALNDALAAVRDTVAATATSVGELTAASGDLRGLAGAAWTPRPSRPPHRPATRTPRPRRWSAR